MRESVANGSELMELYVRDVVDGDGPGEAFDVAALGADCRRGL